MKKSETHLLAGIGVVLQFLLGSGFVLGQPKVNNITIDDAQRPMLAAMGVIEARSGIPIHYRDVPAYYSGAAGVTKPMQPVLSTLVSFQPENRNWGSHHTADSATGVQGNRLGCDPGFVSHSPGRTDDWSQLRTC
jgi:hypothetical protein